MDHLVELALIRLSGNTHIFQAKVSTYTVSVSPLMLRFNIHSTDRLFLQHLVRKIDCKFIDAS
jgi:hypothetical protein